MILIKRMLLGLLIGICAITPGLSGGVIAAALGIYEPAVEAIVNIIRKPKKSIIYLYPLVIGVGAGVLLFSNIMKVLMAQASYEVVYTFFGLIVGSLPALIQEANKNGFQGKYLWAAIPSLAIVLGFDLLFQFHPYDQNIGGSGCITMLLSGMILAFGTLVPGVSSSFLLIYFGSYNTLMNALSGFDLSVLIPVAVGFIAVALPLVKLVEVLFKRYHSLAYYAVMGFLIGSMIIVLPGIRSGWYLLVDILCLLAGVIMSSFLLLLKCRCRISCYQDDGSK